MKVCSIKMILKQFDMDSVKLNPDSIIMQSPTELTQYFIKSWTLKYILTGRWPW